MGLLSNTGLLAASSKTSIKQGNDNTEVQSALELRCDVTPAPFMLRPYAGLYNPFPNNCSVLCNHPADTEAKEYVKRARDAMTVDGKHYLGDDLAKYHDDKDKIRTPHDIFSEDMFRRYAETDSRPLTPAPTLASGKSRGSRRCLTPDQPYPKTTIVVDLRRSHSQETLYYHGYTTSDMTAGHTSANDRSTLPSLNLSEATHSRIIKGQQCEQLPPLASPLVLAKRAERPSKEPVSVRTAKKLIEPTIIGLGPSTSFASLSAPFRVFLGDNPMSPPYPKKSALTSYSSKNQLKALNLNKQGKGKTKTGGDPPLSQRSKGDKTDRDTNDGGSDAGLDDGGSGERRRGKRRRKGRQSDRLTSAGLAAQAQQDPETQIRAGYVRKTNQRKQKRNNYVNTLFASEVAGIGTDSHNASSRGSIAQAADDDDIILPVIKARATRKTDSFLDDDILKYLHREVDEEAIEKEFDIKRRYVLEEALRTRPDRPPGQEMQTLLKEYRVPASSLGDWLHIPRVFSRQNAQFSLPIDSNALQTISPMQYAARFVTLKKSKQMLYLTVLRRFRPEGFIMPKQDIVEGLVLMMGGILTTDHALHFKSIMQWDDYEEQENIPDEIKLTLLNTGKKRQVTGEGGDTEELEINTIKYRTWCGLCAICERMYGRFQPRDKDPPEGMELSDFTMLETRLAVLNVNSGLVEVLNAIRTR